MPSVRRKSLLSSATLALGLVAVVACGHDERGPVATPQAALPREGAGIDRGPSQYVVADPIGPDASGRAIPPGGPGVFGLLVGTTRVIVGVGEARVATDAPDEPLTGVMRVPSRMGGGFLFWTASSLYRAD